MVFLIIFRALPIEGRPGAGARPGWPSQVPSASDCGVGIDNESDQAS